MRRRRRKRWLSEKSLGTIGELCGLGICTFWVRFLFMPWHPKHPAKVPIITIPQSVIYKSPQAALNVSSHLMRVVWQLPGVEEEVPPPTLLRLRERALFSSWLASHHAGILATKTHFTLPLIQSMHHAPASQLGSHEAAAGPTTPAHSFLLFNLLCPTLPLLSLTLH